MKQLLAKFDALMTFGNAKRLLWSIAPTKVRYFAAQVRTLDISEFRDINIPKRRTLLICLLYSAQVKTRDNLVDMFLKRILKIQNNAVQRLKELREKHLAQTSELLNTLSQVLNASKQTQDTYEYIDPLFKGVANWNLISTHWHDMMRVVLSIKAGKVMPSTLLRKLGSYSRKNRLYQAFQELGKVVRTMFLLEYISNIRMRREINAITNVVEKYHHFLD